MFNFSSFFNPPRAAPASSLSDLLADPNASLTRLLEDDNFITEFRSGSPQLRQFMTYRRIQEMIDLITVVGDPADKKRSYKFPLTAADLLSSDVPFVIEKLLPEDGVVVEEERVVSAVEQEVERKVEDDDDLELSSSESSQEEQAAASLTKSEELTHGEDNEDEFGEFVSTPVREKRTVMVKEVVQTVTMVKREHPGLLYKLLDYFSNHINYTLTAYCCRVLTSLLNKSTSKFLPRFFESQLRAVSILSHIESRSTVEFLTRLFTIQTRDHIEDRLTLFKKLLSSSSSPHDLNVMSNISATLCETFDKINANAKTITPCKELQAYLNSIPEMLETAVSNIISDDETVSVYSVGLLFTLVNSLPAELDNDAIDTALFRFADGALEKLQQAVQIKRERIGVGRVRILEVFNFILKRNKIQIYLSQKQLFPLLFSLIRAYPLNNILHNEAFKFIVSSLDPEKKLLPNLLKESHLIDWLLEEAQKEKQSSQRTRTKIPRGYVGHLINLCQLLKEAATTVPLIQQFISSDSRFVDLYTVLVDRANVLCGRDLGGYSTHKPAKLQIMSSRQQILKHYSKFLANSRPPVFENDPDFINPILLEELQRQLDGVDFEDNQQNRPRDIIEEEKHKAELIEENQQHKSAFWKIHLQYDINELIEEVI